jgi:dihydrofolate reductase
MDEYNATGAVLVGRRTAEQAGYYKGDHHRGVPIFVLSHQPPSSSVAKYHLVKYVNDGIESAMARIRRNSHSRLVC